MVAVRSLALFLFWNFVECYFILTGFSFPSGSAPNRGPLRGLEPGNIWSPPIKGANKVQCGGIQDLPSTYGKRVEVTAGSDFQVTGEIINSHGLGKLSFQIKYGNMPDYTWSPGFGLSGNGNFTFAQNFSVVANLAKSGSYSGPATIQVIYTAGSLTYFQCIDVTVRGEASQPGGVNGFGPVELAALIKSQQLGAGNIDANGVLIPLGLSDFHIALIVLCPVVCLLFMFVCYRAYNTGDSVDGQTADVKHDQLPQEPTFTKTKKSSSERRTPTRSSPHTDRTNPATTKTTPSDKDSKDDNADPRGAHFHFQYI